MSDERVDETDFEIERLRALERIFPRVEAERDALAQEVERLRAAHTQVVDGLRQAREGWQQAEARLREVVEAIQTLTDCSYWENLTDYERAMSPVERAALATLSAAAQPEGSACADRAETVEETHKRWAAVRPKEKRCTLHGPLASDGKCDVCEARGIWEGCAAQPEEKL